MAGIFSNLSFEDPGSAPGDADNWGFTYGSSFVEYAGFDSAGDETAVEDFENLWTGLDDWLLALATVGTAQFLTLTTPVGREEFSTLWTGLSAFSLTLTSVAAVTWFEGVNDQPAESFFDGWPPDPEVSGYFGLAFADFTTTSAASFDTAGTPEGVEDFEELWTGLSSFTLTLAGVGTASFDTAGTPEGVEDFEELWTTGTL